MEKRSEEYKDLLCSEAALKNTRDLALSGKLANTTVRSIVWKVFLGCLPRELSHEEWPKVLNIHRKEYKSLLSQYLVDPHEKAREMDPSLDNPLSQAEESPWMKFFKNAELEKEINQDIERTYPEHEFFQQQRVREMMLRILFIYARQTPQLSYKQGMHELLAPIIFLLEREKVEPKDGADEELSQLLSAEYVEHDAFTLFSHLMKVVKEWFQQDSNSPRQQKNQKKDEPFAANQEENNSPIVRKCKYIQNTILREKDPQLFNHLDKLNVEPQLYMLRWVRLLLGREFHLEDLLILWDAMFAYSQDLVLVDYICTAMLIFIRYQLLDRDYTNCMRRLFKFPPVEEVHLFIERALSLLRPSPPEPTAQERESREPRAESPKHVNPAKMLLDPLANTVRQLLADQPQTSYHDLQREYRILQKNQMHMSNRLERIIYSLQKGVVESSLNMETTSSDALLLALAELKQVKDILSGDLPGPGQFEEEERERREQKEAPMQDPLGALGGQD